MKNILLITLISLALFSCAGTSWQWTKTNTVLAASDFVLTGVDHLQTRYIVAHPDKYYETNSILGRHPSDSQVNTYFPIYFGVKLGIAIALPNPYRMWWQSLMIGNDIYYVGHNASLGIGLRF